MSLRAPLVYLIPEDTARVARAAFPKGNPYIRMRDALGPIYINPEFAALFPQEGQPAEAPAQLALITIMQFAEGLSDTQAADAVRGRSDWKYALALELTDAGFDASVLSEFRTRLIAGHAEQRRNAQAAPAFFERAIDETGVTPERVTTDKAKCSPPALRAVLPDAEHRTSKYLNNGIERDHGHLKHRLYPMRSFKRAISADTIARGHALIRNLRNGFSSLTAMVPITLRLAVA